jgi:hypothetical protein
VLALVGLVRDTVCHPAIAALVVSWLWIVVFVGAVLTNTCAAVVGQRLLALDGQSPKPVANFDAVALLP